MSDLISIVNADLGPLPVQEPTLPDNVLQMFSLKGKVASVTGSSRGIGLAVAEAYCQAGADVAIWYNSKPADELARELSKKYNVKVKAYKCNVTLFDEVESVINQIVKDFGTIDIFVANAGVAWDSKRIIDVTDHQDWKRQVETNLDAVYYSSIVMGKIFKANFDKSGTKSKFIITASISGHVVNVPQVQAPYNAIKAATVQLAKSLAVEWGAFANVNSISPGYILTELTADFNPEWHKKWLQLIPMGREANVKELWGAYVFLASDASSYMSGHNMIIDGGYSLP